MITLPPGLSDGATEFFDCYFTKPWDWLSLGEMFVGALKVHWENPAHHAPTIARNALDCLQYAKEGTPNILPSNRLNITTYDNFDENAPFQGVYVEISDLMFEKKVVDNYSAVSDDRATTTYSRSCAVNITARHVHREKNVAALMGTSTFVFFDALRAYLKVTRDFRGFDPQGQSKPRLIENDGARHFMVDVAWIFAFNYRVNIDFESHRLKKYGTQVLPDLSI